MNDDLPPQDGAPDTPEVNDLDAIIEESRRLDAELEARLERGKEALEGAEVISLAAVSETLKGRAKSSGRKKKKPETAEDDGEPEGPRKYRIMWRAIIKPDDEVGVCPALQLGKDCPVIPLGQDKDGTIFWFLNPHGQLISMEMAKMGQMHISGLFAGRLQWLYRNFPQINQHGQWKGFAPQFAAWALQEAAANKGRFDARDKVRGLGCWLDDQDNLIQHLGDQLLQAGQVMKPGEIDGMVYPGRPRVIPPRPGHFDEIVGLMDRLKTWNFVRGAIDVRLLVGWIACAIFGAALEWRPMIFITGDAGTGKSTLLNMIKAMFPGRLVSTVDASAAALRQLINQDSVGVMFDEIEADALNEKAQDVMKLARIAASGGTSYRGGTDHKAAEFTLRGCFAFSAIIPPSMRGQDMQRLAFLRLHPLKGQKLAKLTQAQHRELGAQIVHRVTSQWSRWHETLDAYKEALEAEGHTERSAMQFGSLLAGADLVLGDEIAAPEKRAKWASALRKEALFEYENTTPAWVQAFNMIVQSQPQAWTSDGSPTVAQVLRNMLRDTEPGSWEKYQAKLERAGLSVVKDRAGRAFLAIPPKHPAVSKLFKGTDFQANGGEGAWSIVLRGAPGFKVDDDNPLEATGVQRVDKCRRISPNKVTQIWLDAEYEGQKLFVWRIEDMDEGPAPEVAKAAPKPPPPPAAPLAVAPTRLNPEGQVIVTRDAAGIDDPADDDLTPPPWLTEGPGFEEE